MTDPESAPKMKPAELLAAYAQAIYRVDAEPEPIFLQVGEKSPALERWLAARGARRFAFVSAANPGSRPLPDAENQRRHQQLAERVSRIGLPAIGGESYEATSGGWREASLLVCGVDRETAVALARDFGQVALLYGEIGGPVELVLATDPREENRR